MLKPVDDDFSAEPFYEIRSILVHVVYYVKFSFLKIRFGENIRCHFLNLLYRHVLPSLLCRLRLLFKTFTCDSISDNVESIAPERVESIC